MAICLLTLSCDRLHDPARRDGSRRAGSRNSWLPASTGRRVHLGDLDAVPLGQEARCEPPMALLRPRDLLFPAEQAQSAVLGRDGAELRVDALGELGDLGEVALVEVGRVPV